MSIYGSIDSQSYSNVATTQGPFTLKGGKYAVTAHATWGGGSVTLQRLSANGSTFVTCMTAFSADGFATADLPNGTYQFLIATATAVFVDITSVSVTF